MLLVASGQAECFNSLQTGKRRQRIKEKLILQAEVKEVSIPFKRESGDKVLNATKMKTKIYHVSIPFKRESGYKDMVRG